MKRTLVAVLLLFSCMGVAESTPVAAKEIAGVRQTWTYDAATHSGTLRIENIAHKPIVAYNFSVYETETDGSEFTPSATTKMFGPPSSELFMPGEVKTETVGIPTDAPDSSRVAVDIVIYDDHTAEVTNAEIFQHWIDSDKKLIEEMKKVADIMAAELATSNPDHRQALQAELERRLAPLVAKKKHPEMTNGHESLEESALSEVLMNVTQGVDLAAYLESYRRQIADAEAHSNIQVVD
jgi:hypothetical protein